MLRLYPVKKDKPDARDHIAAPMGFALPSSVDLSMFLGPVKDQQELGACTGFAFCGMREFLYRRFSKYEKTKITTDDMPIFSPMFLYYKERELEGDIHQDNGADSRTGLVVLAKSGVCLETSDPYHPATFDVVPTESQLAEAANYKIGAYHRVLNLETLLSVLASGYVASLAFYVYSSFESHDVEITGAMPMPSPDEAVLGGHEVLVYGYNNDARVVFVRNSWGIGWGKSGNFTMPFDFFNLENGVMDMWIGHLGKPW